MSDTALAIATVMFLWWFGTGAVLFLDGLPRRTYRWTVLGATALLGAALLGIYSSRDDTGVAAAHLAFACALAVWGWNEILFLTGTVTGSRRTRCPEGARGWRRFRFAAESIIYHEVVMAVSGLVVFFLVMGSQNQVAAWTFAALWTMRLSTKLNIFLGVRNLGEDFLPDHLRYLASYFRRAPMNLLFPLSVTASTGLFAWLVMVAAAPGTTAFESVGLTIVATLIALAILEHWFLILPVDPAALWRWGFKSREVGAPAPARTFLDDTPTPLKTAVERARR